MYAKIFESIYDGSLRKDWKALVTFQQLLVLCDPEGYVDKTVEAISARTSIPVEIIQHGIQVLQSPDPDSRSQSEEGRRLTFINPSRKWGWKIVNYGHYRNIRTTEELREYWSGAKRKQRMNELQQTTFELQAKLAEMFKRKQTDAWSYMEESTLAEIARRANCMAEFEEIAEYRQRAGKFFPHSIERLLNSWTTVLDASRNGCTSGELSGTDKMIRLKELERVESRIRTIKNGYDGHQALDGKDKTELVSLRARQSTLKTQLGMQI